MPPIPKRIDINAARPATLDGLKKRGLSAATISRLRRFREAGGQFRDRKDLKLVGLADGEITELLKLVTLGPPQAAEAQKTVDVTTSPAGLVGFRLLFEAYDKDDAPLTQGEVPVGSDGRSRLTYSARAEGGTVALSVKAPDGARVEIEHGGNKGSRLKVIESVLPKHKLLIVRPTATPTVPVPAAAPNPPVRIRGRVLCPDASRKTSGLTVVILAATKPTPARDDFFPVCHGETEDRGYFITGAATFPHGQYAQLTSAQADVAGERIDIRLDTHVATGKSVLPERVILVLAGGGVAAAAAEGKKDDCACHDLDFLKKKVLDEFSYYSVVRTTEPKIEGLTIAESAEVDLEDLLPVGDPLRGKLAGLRLPPDAVAAFLDRQPLIDSGAASRLAKMAQASLLQATLRPWLKVPKGRVVLGGGASIDWDEAPTVYQAIEVAHGHLLQFKQEWLSAGYSTGDLLYSLPLAPGQKKQIVVFDWDRKESAANTQRTDYQDSLYNSLARDRDVNEVARATLTESISGESETSTGGWAVGGGAGAAIPIPAGPVVIPVGALLGAGGGSSGSSSSASQEAARATTASSQQHLADRTVQAANSVRSQRSTVVQTVSQGERFQVSAEVIANYNHCHALTMQYFEVIRHFEVRTRLASVQECLFVPLRIEPFTRRKALRWRNILATCLTRRRLVAGFAAMERIEEETASGADDYYDRIGMPRKRFAEEQVEYLEGELNIRIEMTRPLDDEDGKKVAANWSALNPLLGSDFFALHMAGSKARDEAFVRHAGPKLADELVDRLVVRAVRSGGSRVSLPIDATLMTEFVEGGTLLVSLRLKDGMPQLRREDVEAIELDLDRRHPTLLSRVLEIARVTVLRGSMRYRTRHLHEELFRSTHVQNDLTIAGDRVRIHTPMSQQALRNPRQEDVELHNALLHHLNENLEHYHQCIWLRMDPQRRFMLLDGVVVPGRARNRSAASVVENKLIGVVGNCLVFPVAHGYRLDPTLAEDLDLFTHYHSEPPDPVHLSLPTKGVYAEAVMGQCNSCERKEEDRFWRWEESPIPDSPTTINPVSLPSPTTTQPNLQPQALTAPIINLQNAPASPDPVGFGGLVQLLGNANLFRDVTGLTENQKNAIAALQQAFQLTDSFGSKAVELTNLAARLTPAGQKLEQIKQARANNLLDEAGARERAGSAIDAGSEGSTAETVRQIRQLGELVRSGEVDPGVGRAAIERLAGGIGRKDEKVTDALVRVAEKNAGNFEVTENAESGVINAKFAEGSRGGEKKEGALSTLIDGALTLGKDAALEIVNVLRKNRDGALPGAADGDLAKACREALVKMAEKKLKDEAQSLVKGLPVGSALLVGVKLSLAFAEGVGEEFLEVRGAMTAQFDAEVDRAQVTSDGLDPEAYAALENLRAWQLRNARNLRPIFENGLRRMIGKAVELGVGQATAVFNDALNRLLADIVKQDDLVMLLGQGLQGPSATDDSPGARRRRFLDATLRFMARTFIKQLGDSRMKSALETTLKAAGGTNPVLVDLLAGSIRALLDVEAQEIRQGLGEAFPEVKESLLETARALKLELDATGTLQLTPTAAGVVEAKATGVGAPQAVITLLSSLSNSVPTLRMSRAADAVFAMKGLAQDQLTAATVQFQRRVDQGRLPRDLAQDGNFEFTLGVMRGLVRAYSLLDETVVGEATRVGDAVLPSDAARRATFIDERLFVTDDLRFFEVQEAGREPHERAMSARAFVKQSDDGAIDL